MKTAVIGAGAIGSVVAAYLTKDGKDVTLIAHEGQEAVINDDGLRVNGVRGEEIVEVNVTTQIDREYDLVIFTVKTQDIEAAVMGNKEYFGNAMILSSQNGVQTDTLLSKYFPQKNLFSSIVMFGATYVRPGEVTFNFEGDWVIGKPFEPVNDKVKEIAEFIGEAFPVVISEDIVGMKWLKLFVNFNNCIPAVIGKSMQETFADVDMCRLSIMLLKEGLKTVQKANIDLVSLPNFPAERINGMAAMPIDQAAAIIQKTLTTLSEEPLYGSILQSIMRKRKSEIDYINGEVLHIAKQIKMSAPLNNMIVKMVHDVESTGVHLEPHEIMIKVNDVNEKIAKKKEEASNEKNSTTE